MSAFRFASAVVNSSTASFAVLRLEPAATMPPSTAVTASAITDGSNWIALTNVGGENGPAAHHGDPTNQDKFAAALDPGGELIDLRLKQNNLIAIAVVHGASL
jgi:hypothetical protein